MPNKLSLFSLTLLIVSAIASIRTLPTTALFGGPLLFFYLGAALLFLVPVALVSAEFSSRNREDGGIFHWIKSAFGARAGALAVWLQWINTMVWYPTMLLFIAGTLGHLIDPALASNPLFLLPVSLLSFWGLTFLNLRGIQSSARLNALCALAGTLLPMLFLIGLGVWWFFTQQSAPLSFHVEAASFLEGSNCLVTVMASLLGIELAGVYIRDISEPERNYPKALSYSIFILLGVLILGSLSVACVVPKEGIHFADGVMQTFTTFLHAFGLPFLVPLLAFLIALGSIGGSINWILAPARGLEQMAEDRFLPSYFLAKNGKGVPHRILLLQAWVITLFSCAMHFAPSINNYYWLLMAVSTGLYMLMYVLLFLGALKLGRSGASYKIPQGLRTLSCLAGIFSCLLTLGIGLQPPPGALLEHPLLYALGVIFLFGLLLVPVPFFWRLRERAQEV